MQTTETSRAVDPAVVNLVIQAPIARDEQARAGRAVPPAIPIPIPIQLGSRFVIWKQDPIVLALGRRLVYVPGLVLDGPRDTRINTSLPGTTPVARTASGDFIFSIADSAEADCAHSFAVVRQTLTLYERFRAGVAIPWAWNTATNKDVLTVFPRAGITANAFYSRTQKALKFFFFTPSGGSTPVFTCRSLDIVAHETGHAILDGLRPGWLVSTATPQTGALHEAFGDISALLLALSQLDQVEAVIAITKANLHEKNFLAAVAEQFGTALGQSIGLRNADNDLKLSQVSNQVHALSQVFTGGIYDVLADIFAYERNQQSKTKDPAQVLLEVGQHVGRLLLTAIVKAPATNATFANVVNEMLKASFNQDDPAIYRAYIRNRFTFREVVVSPTPLAAAAPRRKRGGVSGDTEGEDVLELTTADVYHVSLTGTQDRSGCCGTMQNPEYYQAEEALEAQLEELREPGAAISGERILAGLSQ